MAAFKPPELYDFPPFFTLQPVFNTRQKQLQMWLEYVASYMKHKRRSTIKISDEAKSELFCNSSRGCKLSTEAIQSVLDFMVVEGYAAWDDEKKSSCICTWKKFSDWSKDIYAWAAENAMVGTVCTLYEIYAGDSAKDSEFFGLAPAVVMRAVTELEKKGKVSVIPGDNLPETGIKFH